MQTPPPSQAPSDGSANAGVVLRLWPEGPRKFHTVTVLQDGRIITTSYPPGAESPSQGTSVERRLTTAGVQLFQSELDATGLTFLASADWLPVDQPWDGLPSSLEVGLSGGGRSIVNWLRMCTNPETEALDGLADRLATIEEWLPANAWADATARPYTGPL